MRYELTEALEKEMEATLDASNSASDEARTIAWHVCQQFEGKKWYNSTTFPMAYGYCYGMITERLK